MADSLSPAAGFDWRRVNWGRPDSPPSALCSYCSRSFQEEDVPLRFWTQAGFAAAFCDACQAAWWRTAPSLRASGDPLR
jgi:hypothetical protein